MQGVSDSNMQPKNGLKNLYDKKKLKILNDISYTNFQYRFIKK